MPTRDRQVWIRGAERWCSHDPEEIYSQGGALIAKVCRRCRARLVEIGRCDGACRSVGDVELTAFLVTGKRPRRFHNEACRQQTIQAEKAARAEATAATRASQKGARK